MHNIIVRQRLWRRDLQQHSQAAGPAPSTFAIFGPHLWWTTLRCSLLALGAQGGYYAITTWLPTFLRTERHITVVGSLSYLLVVTVGSFFGYGARAYLNDFIGRRLNFVLFATGSGLIVFGYTHLDISDNSMEVTASNAACASRAALTAPLDGNGWNDRTARKPCLMAGLAPSSRSGMCLSSKHRAAAVSARRNPTERWAGPRAADRVRWFAKMPRAVRFADR